MAVFQVGVLIEKTVLSDMVVRVEADTLAEAEKKALVAARAAVSNAFDDDSTGMRERRDWDTQDFTVSGISEDSECYSHRDKNGGFSYNADLDFVTKHSASTSYISGMAPAFTKCNRIIVHGLIAGDGEQPDCAGCLGRAAP